jgi:hypothetical protein
MSPDSVAVEAADPLVPGPVVVAPALVDVASPVIGCPLAAAPVVAPVSAAVAPPVSPAPW